MSKSVRPFHCGSQYGDWTSSNCDRCEKGSHLLGANTWPDCELEAALVEAYVGDGYIEKEIAQRLGVLGGTFYSWKCPEITLG